ncbi:MAG: asparagine synthase (glutamine-hydrolyzing) [Alphaproteobacteria bacterium]|nr:asparagine synthase (glutamine-hydrolyzing) [Alphaproteobacteria bacterium]MCB9792010.1 asparagine synthase (glutamine-hydrolyzing) [Alphaproteobacteria bacterium]
MGGIAGIIHFRGQAPETGLAEAMSAAVAHRGPDDAGLWAEGPACLVQRRMALTLAGRRQPIHSERFVLTLDGRIYELGALREALRKEGVEPETTGDADLVLAAWGVWGEAVLERLEGDYALAVWDRRDKVLHLARDPVGVKPLYYAQKGDRFAFASDVRALLLLPWVSRALAPEELAEYLSFRYTHAPRTLLRDVWQLPAASAARVDSGSLKVRPLRTPAFTAPGAPLPDEADAQARLETALARSVERRSQADHPVGVLLSGGTASSAILAMCAERGPVRSFNVSFADEAPDEAAYAGRVATLFGADHEILRVGREDFVRGVDAVVDALGQPVTSPAAIPQHLLMQAAREQVRVLLSGDGTDELLGGSRVEMLQLELRAARAHAALPGPARWALRRSLRRAGFSAPLPQDLRGYGLAHGVGGSNVFDVDTRMAILRDPALVRPRMRHTMLAPFYEEVDTDPINEALHAYFRGWLPEDSLLRSDRVSTAVGMEVRYPLLDSDLVALAQGWPGRAKVKRRRGRWHAKWPLKQLLEAKGMPGQLVWRPKRGMVSPLNRWLRGEGEAFLWERVESVCADPLGLFKGQAIRDLARAHAREEADHGPRLWTLIFFDLWYRRLVSP